MTTALSRHRPSGALSQGELILGVLPCLACLTGTPFAGASPAAGALALPLPRTCPFSPSAGHPLRRGKMTLPLSHKSCDGAHLQGPPYAGVMLRVCDTNAHLQGTPSAGVELRVVCRRT